MKARTVVEYNDKIYYSCFTENVIQNSVFTFEKLRTKCIVNITKRNYIYVKRNRKNIFWGNSWNVKSNYWNSNIF